MTKATSFYTKENKEMWESKPAHEKRMLQEELKKLQETHKKEVLLNGIIKINGITYKKTNGYTKDPATPAEIAEYKGNVKRDQAKIKEIKEKLKYYGTAY